MSGTTQYVGPNAVYVQGDETVLQQIIPAYVYRNYADDDDIQAFTIAQNSYATQFLLWFNTLNLPIYTGGIITGALLDLVGNNIYGTMRPSVTTGGQTSVDATATYYTGLTATATRKITSTEALQSVNDDIYRRVLTWNYYKGDGFVFSIQWLKRRVYRFMFGPNGIPPDPQDNTYAVSVSVSGSAFTIAVDIADPTVGTLLNSLIGSGACAVPFLCTFTLTASSNLQNVSGALNVSPATGYPTSSSGLPEGSIWDNAGAVNVVPGVTPNPSAMPVYFGTVSSLDLLELGGGNLPLTAPISGSLQLWNNSNAVEVA
jgi:hypothetical protein